MFLMNREEVESEVKKINNYLKKCLWMDFDLSSIGEGKIVVSGSIDMTYNEYAIDIYFEQPYYISSLFSWETDTEKIFIELVKGKEEEDMNRQYRITKGNYIFKIYPESYDDFKIYIVAKKIRCEIINEQPF